MCSSDLPKLSAFENKNSLSASLAREFRCLATALAREFRCVATGFTSESCDRRALDSAAASCPPELREHRWHSTCRSESSPPSAWSITCPAITGSPYGIGLPHRAHTLGLVAMRWARRLRHDARLVRSGALMIGGDVGARDGLGPGWLGARIGGGRRRVAGRGIATTRATTARHGPGSLASPGSVSSMVAPSGSGSASCCRVAMMGP